MCSKFRTVIPDAEQRRSMVASLDKMDGPVFKQRNDPRVPCVGRWQRRTSLDDLP